MVVGGLITDSVQVALGTPIFLLLGFGIMTLLNALEYRSVFGFVIKRVNEKLSFQVEKAVAEVG